MKNLTTAQMNYLRGLYRGSDYCLNSKTRQEMIKAGYVEAEKAPGSNCRNLTPKGLEAIK